MYDFHLHSNFSVDCKVPPEDMVKEAIKMGLKAICFTDHIDLSLDQDKSKNVLFNIEDYIKEINKLKYTYINEIEVLKGAEFGLQLGLIDEYDELSKNPFDFILCSIHSIDGERIFSREKSFESDYERGQVRYYTELLEVVKRFDSFDSLAHIDFIDRYYKFNDIDYEFSDAAKELVYEILKVLVDKGKALEINTAALRYDMKSFHPQDEILDMYKSLGGELITVGSDAHYTEDLAYGIKDAEKYLKEKGFKYLYIYKKRRPYPIHL